MERCMRNRGARLASSAEVFKLDGWVLCSLFHFRFPYRLYYIIFKSVGELCVGLGLLFSYSTYPSLSRPRHELEQRECGGGGGYETSKTRSGNDTPSAYKSNTKT